MSAEDESAPRDSRDPHTTRMIAEAMLARFEELQRTCPSTHIEDTIKVLRTFLNELPPDTDGRNSG
jgi:hypothetical protein